MIFNTVVNIQEPEYILNNTLYKEGAEEKVNVRWTYTLMSQPAR